MESVWIQEVRVTRRPVALESSAHAVQLSSNRETGSRACVTTSASALASVSVRRRGSQASRIPVSEYRFGDESESREASRGQEYQ